MALPRTWIPTLQRSLAEERILGIVEGPFSDGPKSMRVGLYAVTDRRLVFYRRKLFGEELIGTQFCDVASVDADGGGINEVLGSLSLVITTRDGRQQRVDGLHWEEFERMRSLIAERIVLPH